MIDPTATQGQQPGWNVPSGRVHNSVTLLAVNFVVPAARAVIERLLTITGLAL
jgi:hypothetical protein